MVIFSCYDFTDFLQLYVLCNCFWLGVLEGAEMHATYIQVSNRFCALRNIKCVETPSIVLLLSGNYTDIECPARVCSFVDEPVTPYFWDDECQMGMLGCNADGIHVQCRFCAKIPFQQITCPESARPPYGECWFPHAPLQTHYWDPTCTWGQVGCWADGVHAECRYCGGDGAYANITCP